MFEKFQPTKEAPKEATQIKILESLKFEWEIDWQAKRDLAFLILGIKPVVGLSMVGPRGVENEVEVEEKFKKEAGYIKDALEKMGLYFRLQLFDYREALFGYSFLIAKDEAILNQAIEATENNDTKKLGLLFGYPKTAVESFKTPEAFDYRSELPDEELKKLKKEGVLRFLNFSPSRRHWKEELEIARRNQRLVREKAPSLYQQIVEGS